MSTQQAKNFWLQLESAAQGSTHNLHQALEQLAFNSAGLIPAIAQQTGSGEVLMLAWMNRQALQITLEEGRVCYWSRSRQQLWRKGETSGQVQWLKSIRLDCDGDALLLEVDQQGPACHTGRKSCFYLAIQEQNLTVTSAPEIDPAQLYAST